MGKACGLCADDARGVVVVTLNTTLTATQFDALAALMSLSIETPRGRALRAVLCDGATVAAAARAEGIAHQPVYRAVENAKKTLALAEACLRGSVP